MAGTSLTLNRTFGWLLPGGWRGRGGLCAGRTEPILDAVLRLRQDAPYACKGGVCGSCRAKLLEGAVDMRRTYALEQDDIDRGYVLTCQSRPASDTVVLDYDG